MRVLILGGDGYLGWPTAMHLTAKGHDVAVVDNYLRRRLCREENVEPLFEVPNLHERVGIWESVSGYKIPVFIGDLAQWDFVEEVFTSFNPEGIVHYAEQPAAPYSMLNRRAASLTLKNNLMVTANVILPSIIDSKANRKMMSKADYSKWVRPEQIAAAMSFLCSDAGAAVNGARIPLYGAV